MERELKKCPFCGSSAVIVKEPLWQGNHGYQGCYMVEVKCMNPLCDVSLPHQKYDTIYHEMEEAEANAIQAWNKRADE